MDARWTKTKSPLANMVGIDPYLDLALERENGGFCATEHEQGKEWISVLIRLKEDVTVKDFAEGLKKIENLEGKSLGHVPAFYTVKGLDTLRYCTAYVRQDFFDCINEELTSSEKAEPYSLVEAISRLAFGEFHEAFHPPEAPPDQPADARREPSYESEIGTVVIGIIDDGIAFAHERFRSSPTQTRIEYIWLQEQPATHNSMSSSCLPSSSKKPT